MASVIEFIYLVFCALIGFIAIRRLIKTDSKTEEILLVFVLVPLVLRILQLK